MLVNKAKFENITFDSIKRNKIKGKFILVGHRENPQANETATHILADFSDNDARQKAIDKMLEIGFVTKSSRSSTRLSNPTGDQLVSAIKAL